MRDRRAGRTAGIAQALTCSANQAQISIACSATNGRMPNRAVTGGDSSTCERKLSDINGDNAERKRPRRDPAAQAK